MLTGCHTAIVWHYIARIHYLLVSSETCDTLMYHLTAVVL